jgi:hypothetical protein
MERYGNVPVDQPCGEQSDHEDRPADGAEADQGAAEGDVNVIDPCADEEHQLPRFEFRHIVYLRLRFLGSGLERQILDNAALGGASTSRARSAVDRPLASLDAVGFPSRFASPPCITTVPSRVCKSR